MYGWTAHSGGAGQVGGWNEHGYGQTAYGVSELTVCLMKKRKHMARRSIKATSPQSTKIYDVHCNLFLKTMEVPAHVWMRQKWSTGCSDMMKGKAMPVEAGLKTVSEIQGLVLENT